MPQERAGPAFKVGKLRGHQVVAFGVRQADVHVQAAAGQVAERLGHKAGNEAMFVGHALDQALVADALIDRLQGVEAVLQGQLQLAGGVLGNRRAHRQALGLAGAVEVVEEGLLLFQFQHAIHLRRLRAHAVGLHGRLRAAIGVAVFIQQVELQLHRHHRVVAVGLEALNGARQHMARITGGGRRALGRVHAHLHLAGGVGAPGLQGQAAGERVGPAVGIGDFPDQAAFLDVLALDGQREDRAGQRAAVFVDRQQLVAVQQLAARDAVGVDQHQLDQAHLGVLGEEVAGFLGVGEVHAMILCGGVTGERRVCPAARPEPVPGCAANSRHPPPWSAGSTGSCCGTG